MNKNKYVIALIGLALGFLISFFLTQNYNKSNAAPGVSPSQSGMPGAAGGGGGQQAMMGQVQQILSNAKSNPKDLDAQVEAARAFYQVGRVKEATEYLEKAYDLDTSNFTVAANLGILYSDQGNYPAAEKYFRRAIEIKGDEPEVYTELGATFINRETPEPDKAIQALQQALKVDPKSGHALGHLVEAYALKKDARDAEDALNRLKAADPTNQRVPAQRVSALETLVADLKAGKAVNIPKE